MAKRFLLLTVLACSMNEAPAFWFGSPLPAFNSRSVVIAPSGGATLRCALHFHTALHVKRGERPPGVLQLASSAAAHRGGAVLLDFPLIGRIRRRHLMLLPPAMAFVYYAGLEVLVVCGLSFAGGLLLMGVVGGFAIFLARYVDLRVRARLKRQLTLLRRDLRVESKKEKALQLHLWQSSGGVFGIFGTSGFLTKVEMGDHAEFSDDSEEAPNVLSSRVTSQMISSVRKERSRSQSSGSALTDDEGVQALSSVREESPPGPSPSSFEFDAGFPSFFYTSKPKEEGQGGDTSLTPVDSSVAQGDDDAWSVVCDGDPNGYCVLSHKGGHVVVEIPMQGDGLLFRAGTEGQPINRVWADGSPTYQRFSFQTRKKLLEKMGRGEDTRSLQALVQGGIAGLGRWDLDSAVERGHCVTLRNRKSGESISLSADGMRHLGRGRVVHITPGGEWSEVVEQRQSPQADEEGGGVTGSGDGSKTDEELNGGAAANADMPEDLICPLLLDPMQDPWVAADGNSYERVAISQWLKENDTSPVTGEKLAHKNIMPNNSLMLIIKAMQKSSSLA